MERLKQIIYECVVKVISERYSDSATPINSKTWVRNNLGKDTTAVDTGNHPTNDILSQVSSVDWNGERFGESETVVLSPNKFTIYKIKNFGNDKIGSSIDLFGRGASGEKNFRREIDVLNGAARRNGRGLIYRKITTDAKSRRGSLANSFWEFSFDGGSTWYIMKPNGTQNMQQTKLVRRQ